MAVRATRGGRVLRLAVVLAALACVFGESVPFKGGVGLESSRGRSARPGKRQERGNPPPDSASIENKLSEEELQEPEPANLAHDNIPAEEGSGGAPLGVESGGDGDGGRDNTPRERPPAETAGAAREEQSNAEPHEVWVDPRTTRARERQPERDPLLDVPTAVLDSKSDDGEPLPTEEAENGHVDDDLSERRDPDAPSDNPSVEDKAEEPYAQPAQPGGDGMGVNPQNPGADSETVEGQTAKTDTPAREKAQVVGEDANSDMEAIMSELDPEDSAPIDRVPQTQPQPSNDRAGRSGKTRGGGSRSRAKTGAIEASGVVLDRPLTPEQRYVAFKRGEQRFGLRSYGMALRGGDPNRVKERETYESSQLSTTAPLFWGSVCAVVLAVLFYAVKKPSALSSCAPCGGKDESQMNLEEYF